MEHIEFPGDVQPPRRGRLVAIAAISLISLAAISRLAWNSLTWEMDTTVARQLVDSPSAVEQRAAAVRLLRDCTESIAALQRMANSGTAEGAEQAKIALQHLHRATER